MARGFANTPLPVIDVPFHSRYLPLSPLVDLEENRDRLIGRFRQGTSGKWLVVCEYGHLLSQTSDRQL